MAGIRRVLLEGCGVLLVAVLAWFGLNYDVAGTALLIITAVAAVVVVRLLPDGTDTTAWPPLPAPERGGRRAEIYRLSWQIDDSGAPSAGVLLRLRTAVSQLQPIARGADREVLFRAAALLAPDSPEPRRLGRSELVRLLQQLEEVAARVSAAAEPGGHVGTGPESRPEDPAGGVAADAAAGAPVAADPRLGRLRNRNPRTPIRRPS